MYKCRDLQAQKKSRVDGISVCPAYLYDRLSFT